MNILRSFKWKADVSLANVTQFVFISNYIEEPTYHLNINTSSQPIQFLNQKSKSVLNSQKFPCGFAPVLMIFM